MALELVLTEIQFHYKYQNICQNSEMFRRYRNHPKEKITFFFKEQEYRTLNTILYCSAAGWAETFDETWELEEHMLSGKLSIHEEIASIV